MRLLLVGGDRRALMLAPLLKTEGFEVHTLGLEPGDEENRQVAWADALVFAYPFAVRSGCVPALTGLTLYPDDVLREARDGVLILAGRELEPYVLPQKERGFRLMRYDHVEALAQKNAELSAEAAVCEMMQRTDKALMDLRVLVVGYGLFGRALAKRLLTLGAEVWIAARRKEQRMLAASDGMHAVAVTDLPLVMPKTEMLLNTVPAQVIGEQALRAMKPGGWLLELASAPYGFDRELASAMGLNAEVLPALPARYAPLSAAMALKQAVIRLLAEGKV